MRNKLDFGEVAREMREARDRSKLPGSLAVLFRQCRATLIPWWCEIPQKMAFACFWMARGDAARHGLGEGNEYGEQRFS